MPSFDQLASVTASTKRLGAVVSGLEAAPATNIVSLTCLPLDPVDPDLIQIEGLAWHELLQTAVDGGLDIIEGDILVVGSSEYPVRAVADWTWPPNAKAYRILFLEDRK